MLAPFDLMLMRPTLLFLAFTLAVFPPDLLAQSAPTITLSTVLARTLAAHPTVSAASARVDAARGSRATAGAWMNPSFTLEQENAAYPGRAAPPGMERQVSAFVMVPLDPTYQRRPMIREADRLLEAAGADVSTTRLRLSLDAARTFYRLAHSQIALGSAADIQIWLDSLLTYTRIRVEQGAAAEGDLIRLQIERDRLETDFAMARVETRRAQADLAQFVGSDSLVADFTQSSLSITPLPSRADVLTRALAQRPELVAARARTAAADAGRGVQRAATFRDASAMVGTMNTGGVNTFMAGVTLPMPVLNQNRGGIQRATAETRVAEFETQAIERMVTAEVIGAYDAARILTEQMARLENGFLQRAEEARRIAVGAYREGASPLMQVLDAARALADARDTYYRTLFAQQQSLIELRAAIGASDLLAPIR